MKNKVHFSAKEDLWTPSCGVMGSSNTKSTIISKVTCENCKRTKIFKQIEQQKKDGWTQENIDKAAFKKESKMRYKVGDKIIIDHHCFPHGRPIEITAIDEKSNRYSHYGNLISDEIIDHEATAKLNCKYPGLKAAIMARKDMKIRVTPEQSAEVQKIAFECGIYWNNANKSIINTTANHALFILKNKNSNYILTKSISKLPSLIPEFSLAHDCFVDEIKKEYKQVDIYEDGITEDEIKQDNNKFGEYLKVFIEIANEVQRAESKHPNFPADLIHQAAVLNEESGEVTKAALDHIYFKKPIADVYTEAIHNAAVAVRMLLNRKDK